ncbi:VTC domain-containing protein, partial [Mesorhizobium sp. M00.F.Ca.ET.217.01.1.1]|uniref:VTC domain-containing protein n=1 Tax=Mesorhizobium sp. M00.F.Ca.ET.217.01.1.1 TaxID=2500529 RepID=UPI001AEEEA18
IEADGLDELVAEASLQTRVDRKYVLDRERAEGVLAWLAPETRVLEIDGTRALAYESVYFDTPDLLSYRLAAHARRRRFKLRTRAYLDTDQAYLEM